MGKPFIEKSYDAIIRMQLDIAVLMRMIDNIAENEAGTAILKIKKESAGIESKLSNLRKIMEHFVLEHYDFPEFCAIDFPNKRDIAQHLTEIVTKDNEPGAPRWIKCR